MADNLSLLKHTEMDLELLNYINVDLKWNLLKKGRRNMTRRPRKPGADGFLSGSIIQDPTMSETNKIVDAPKKKRRLVQQSTSPPPQTSCLHGDGALPPGPQTPSVHYEDPSQRYHSSLSQSQKTKSKTRLRNNNTSKPTKRVDFSGIELLATAACSSFIEDHVRNLSVKKEHTTPEANPCTVGIKETVISTQSNGTEKKIAPLKGLRLHWDLNTVMDEWEEPCDDVAVKPHCQETTSELVKLNSEGYESKCTEDVSVNAAISVVPHIQSCNGDSFEKTCELIEESCSQEVMDKKTITSKTSDCESSVGKCKSDVADLSINPSKCDELSTSTTSVLQEETVVKGEAMSKSDEQAVSEEVMQGGECESSKITKSYCEDKVTSEDPPSEGCGSNVTQDEQCQMGDGDTTDKVEVGYDSPFEDGELREPKQEIVSYESDNAYNDDLGTIENPLSEQVDRGQTMEGQSSMSVKQAVPNNDIVAQKEESDYGSGKEFSERKNAHHLPKNVTRNYNSNIENSYTRSWSREKRDKVSFHDDYEHHRPKYTNRNYNYRNNGYEYDIHRESTRDRYRFHDPKPCYVERKVRCYSPKRRSRSRSRSGSPIAWNFQKRKTLDVTQSPDRVSPERSSRSYDDRKFTDGQFRDKRPLMNRRNLNGYPERFKSDDYSRSSQPSGRFSREHGDGIRKLDGHYEKANRVGRSDDAGVVRR